MERLVSQCLAAAVGAACVRAQTVSPAAPRFAVATVVEFEVGVAAFAPKWSPDGKWIAFSFPKSNGIGLVRTDGSGRRTLTSETGSGYKFAWSPDSTRIVFRSEQAEGAPRHYSISVMDVAEFEIESSTGVIREVQPPVWQRGPQGMRWISCAPSGVVEGPWRKSADQSRTKRSAVANVGPPLIEQRGTELWLYGTDSAKRLKLSGDFGLNPVWSQDGSMFVYDAMDRFAVVKPDAAAAPPRETVVGLNPAWSPDGAWLVYQITRDHSHAADDQRQHTPDTASHTHSDKTNHRIVDSELWIIGADGSGRQQLTNTSDILESDPDWSPDGSAIVCRTEETGRIRVLKLTRP
jgi:Tol biopolymer transport system component